VPNKPRPLLDLRAWQRQEDRRLIITIVLFLVIVGGVTIGLVYGWARPSPACCAWQSCWSLGPAVADHDARRAMGQP